MNAKSVTKSVAAVLVLALAAGGLGCAAPAEGSSDRVDAKDEAPVGQSQQQLTAAQAPSVLSGILGIVTVTNMIKMQVTYGQQIGMGDIYAETQRLQDDITMLRATFTAQSNANPVQAKAEQPAVFQGTGTEPLDPPPPMDPSPRSGPARSTGP